MSRPLKYFLIVVAVVLGCFTVLPLTLVVWGVLSLGLAIFYGLLFQILGGIVVNTTGWEIDLSPETVMGPALACAALTVGLALGGYFFSLYMSWKLRKKAKKS